MSLTKRGHTIAISWEMAAALNHFARLGYWTEQPPTDEQIRAHARAKAALEEIEENPYIDWPRMEDELGLLPLQPTRTFVPTETIDEYEARFRAHLAEKEN